MSERWPKSDEVVTDSADDIVKQLRSYALNVSTGVEGVAKEMLTWQAADEIERLTAALRNARDNVKIEIEREELQALLELASDLDQANHYERGVGEYKEDELITRLRAKYMETGKP